MVTCHKIYPLLIPVGFLRFQSSNEIKVKPYSKYQNVYQKDSILRTCPKTFKEFGNFRKIARRVSAMKEISIFLLYSKINIFFMV